MWRPNKRLKLAGGDRSKGNGVFAPWRARDFVQQQLRRWAGRPQLKRDPLDGYDPRIRTTSYVSVWRRKAIALFPELAVELVGPEFPLHEFFFRLASLAVQAHKTHDDAVLRRVHGFAEWCLHQEGDLWREAGIGFYEDLFAEVPWEEIVPWLSPFVSDQVKKTWALGVGGERAGQFEKLIRDRRHLAYRTHAFATGEIDAL